ncbi:urocortin [Elgaria multicarinata webbii]|uniref:urocortin n=1 Tax=Elgaria multicarinata webbii TaxID=159646 RepID=UPI002FCD134B
MSRTDVNGAPGALYIKTPPAAPASFFPVRPPESPSMRLPALVASLLLLPQLCRGVPPVPDHRDLGLMLLLPPPGKDGAAPWPWPAAGPDVAALPVRAERHRVAPDGELRRRLKRHEPPLSIDLTFHLLRRLMESARRESLAAQAEENRRLLESVGK